MSPKKSSAFHGVLLVDKPAGITSHDVVDRVRRLFGTRRVGHAGTLDPQATGLLVLLVGEATKISEYLMGMDKSYEGVIRLGVVSDTYDADGEVVAGPGGKIPRDIDALQDFATELTGEIKQVPPAFSACKVDGKKLYEYAREGTSPAKVEARRIRVDDFELLALEGDRCEFGIDCSSGTYVRSLVHEVGLKAGCGAILAELRRTDIGSFGIEDAYTLEELQEMQTAGTLEESLLPIREALADMPAAFLVGGAEAWLARGQALPYSMLQMQDDTRPKRGDNVLLCRIDGTALAIARVDPAPLSPPPKAMVGAAPPWFQPIKQFDTAAEEA